VREIKQNSSILVIIFGALAKESMF